MDISGYLIGLILAFSRVSAFLFMLPYLKSRFIPIIAKVTLALAISMPAASQMGEVSIRTMPDLVGMIIVQVLIGLTLAFVVEIIMSAPNMAGSLLDIDFGFAAAQIMDPGTNQRATVIANIFSILFMLVFILVGGFNFLISSIVYSFKFTTPSFFFAEVSFIEMLMSVFSFALLASVQIAIPFVATMFIVNFMLLVIGKSAPQMNIFQNMFAVKIAVGILFLYITLPFLGEVFAQLNESLMEKHTEAMEVILKK